jgi:hypothetical protein
MRSHYTCSRWWYWQSLAGCVQTAHSMAFCPNCNGPWRASLWRTASVLSHSCPGLIWIILLGQSFVKPSNIYRATQDAVRTQAEAILRTHLNASGRHFHSEERKNDHLHLRLANYSQQHGWCHSISTHLQYYSTLNCARVCETVLSASEMKNVWRCNSTAFSY